MHVFGYFVDRGASDEGQSISQDRFATSARSSGARASCGSSARTRATSSGRVKSSMARIAGVDLPRNKRMEIALTYIYGIGRARSREILQGGRRVARQEQRRSRRQRDPPHPRVDRAAQLQGRRRPAPRGRDEHQAPDGPRLLPRPAPPQGLPVRGQRTHTNARTRKGPRKGQMHRKKRRRAAQEVSISHGRSIRSARSRQGKPKARRSRRTSRAASRTSVDVQQHDRHDHRRLGQRGRVVVGGRAGFKGSRKWTPFAAQLAAEDAAHKAMEHGMRSSPST